jgi:hypothetical protein
MLHGGGVGNREVFSAVGQGELERGQAELELGVEARARGGLHPGDDGDGDLACSYAGDGRCGLGFGLECRLIQPDGALVLVAGKGAGVGERNGCVPALRGGLPKCYGPWQTVWKRHRRSSGDGTWDKIHAALLSEADAAGLIEWEVSVD